MISSLLHASCIALVILRAVQFSLAFAPVIPAAPFKQYACRATRAIAISRLHETNSSPSSDVVTESSAPTLDAKRVLPYKILLGGIKGHRVAAVYAVMNAQFKRGTNGWDACEYVGVSQDLAESLSKHLEKHGAENVAHIRTLSFATPDPNAMQQVAQDWRNLVQEAGKTLQDWGVDSLEYLYDEDEDDDEDDDDDLSAEEALAARIAEAEGMVYIRPKKTQPAAADQPIISPFENSSRDQAETSEALSFTQENVDKVLNEVRPYLIADGGNVKVEKVDEIEKNVYLKLEGACGSCESSTVTMQMGIERTLRENFPDMKEVIRVDSDAWKPTELTEKVVEEEVNRLKPAIVAMGGTCEIISVDSVTGVVDLKFRGAAKVRQGLELALLDVPLLNKVNFLMGDD